MKCCSRLHYSIRRSQAQETKLEYHFHIFLRKVWRKIYKFLFKILSPMASLKTFNRLLFRPNLRAAFRKNISTVKRGHSILSFNSHVLSLRSKNSGLLSASLSFSRVCGCGMHNHISEGILLSIVLFKCVEHI